MTFSLCKMPKAASTLARSGDVPAVATPAETPAAAPVAASYEDAMAELERLVAAMEGGQMPLDKLLEGYQRGAELLGYCRARLAAVEQQVQVLEEGQLKPWAAA